MVFMLQGIDDEPLIHPFEAGEFEEEREKSLLEKIPSFYSREGPILPAIPKKAVFGLAVLVAVFLFLFVVWPLMLPAAVRLHISVEDTEGEPIENNKISFMHPETGRLLLSKQGSAEYDFVVSQGNYVVAASAPSPFKTESFPVKAEENITQTLVLAKDLGVRIADIDPLEDIAAGEERETIITLKSNSSYQREISLVFSGFEKLGLESVPEKIIVPSGGTAKATIIVKLRQALQKEGIEAGSIRVKYTHESFPFSVKLLRKREQ